MKLLNLIVLKKQDFKMYKISAQTFVQGIEDMVDLLMKIVLIIKLKMHIILYHNINKK